MFIGTLNRTTDEGLTGQIFSMPAQKGMGITLYNASTATKGKPYLVGYSVTADQEQQAIAPATKAFDVVTVIALADYSAGKIGRYQLSGACECLVDDTGTLAAGRGLEVLNGGTYLVDDGNTVQLTTTVGFLVDAVTAGEGSGSPVLKTVILTGQPHTIAAS